jgi:hypothetical protein
MKRSKSVWTDSLRFISPNGIKAFNGNKSINLKYINIANNSHFMCFSFGILNLLIGIYLLFDACILLFKINLKIL